MKVLISGSSGLIGRALFVFLQQKGWEVQALSRPPFLVDELDGVDVIVHLAGESISQGLWTSSKKRKIYDSRVMGTRLLVEALEKTKRPPKVFLCASAVGYYEGQMGAITEKTGPGMGFLANVCQGWESAAQEWKHSSTRVVLCRFGYIFSKQGGMLKALLPMFSAGLGVVFGSGKQYVPWISLEDAARALYHIILEPALEGPVNIVAEKSVSQKEYADTLARALHRPRFLRIPAAFLLGEKMKALVLNSLEVYPERLLSSGFSFSNPTLEAACRREFPGSLM